MKNVAKCSAFVRLSYHVKVHIPLREQIQVILTMEAASWSTKYTTYGSSSFLYGVILQHMFIHLVLFSY